MEEILKQLLEGQKRLETRLDQMESRLDEHSKILKTLMHASEVQKAEQDRFFGILSSVAEKMATKEDIALLEEKIEVLTLRELENRADIRLLKKAE